VIAAAMTSKRERQLGISATTFLVLCIWLGPRVACWLIGIAGVHRRMGLARRNLF
jgi:hypothetical protein